LLSLPSSACRRLQPWRKRGHLMAFALQSRILWIITALPHYDTPARQEMYG
jgi:hypothetical protein